MAQSGSRVDIEEFMDRPLGFWRWFVFALCGLAMAIEGYDLAMLATIVPTLAEGLGVDASTISVIFVAQGIGLALGYIVVAPQADRIGRKTVIVWSMAGFGILTAATAFANTLGMVAALRFAAFIFFGGITTNIISLVAEFSPKHLRARQIILVNACFALGAAGGTMLAPVLADRFDWTAAFLLGGIVPLALLPILLVMLPESPRFLVTAGRPVEHVQQVLSRIAPIPAEVGSFSAQEDETGRMPFTAIFKDGRTLMTLLFAVASGMMMFVNNIFASWAPTLWHLQAGFKMEDAAATFAVSAIGAIVWPFVMIYLIGALGLKRTLVVCYLVGGAAMFVYTVQPFTHALAAFMALTYGSIVVGAVSGLYALISSSYPTQIRATALGFTAGVGRLFAILGPAIGGYLLAEDAAPVLVAFAFGFPLALAALAVGIGGGLQRCSGLEAVRAK